MDLQNLLDQRHKPRFEVSLNGQLTSSDGQSGECIIRNLSSSGLQLECPLPLAMSLMPNQGQQSPSRPIEIDVTFDIPTTRAVSKAVKISCGIVYVRRVSTMSHALGCQFHQFHGESLGDLEEYLSHFSSDQPKQVQQPE